MSKYVFKCEIPKYDMYRGNQIGIDLTNTQEFEADDLDTIISNFEMFLRGCGFYFRGNLDIVPEEEFSSNDCLSEKEDTI